MCVGYRFLPCAVWASTVRDRLRKQMRSLLASGLGGGQTDGRTRLDFSRQKTRANRGIQNKYFKPVGLQIYPWQEILSFRRTNGIANIFFGSKFSAFVEPMGLQIFSTIGAATINFGSKSSVFVITDGTAKKKNVASSQLGRPPRQTQNVEP